jgi:sulfate adenylyltransferase subunit 2
MSATMTKAPTRRPRPSASTTSTWTVLEAEAIHIIREVAAEFERPVLLFSGGKDSVVMLHLAEKAFAPAPLPFPVMHVDTGHNFPEVLAFRDATVERLGLRLVVASVQDDIDDGRLPRAPRRRRATGCRRCRCSTPSPSTASTPCFGGARRDEEKARAKERVFSLPRRASASGTRRTSGPSCGTSTTVATARRAHAGVPAVELDRARRVAVHRAREASPARRSTSPTSARSSSATACCSPPNDDSHAAAPGETPVATTVRFRTVGDMTLHRRGRIPAPPSAEVIAESRLARLTERGATRADDKMSEAAMEDRKKEGYF